jgi:hypothetical protein
LNLSSEVGSYTSTKNKRRERNMAKHVYLSFIIWKDGMNMELYMNKIKPKLVNDEIKLLHDGFVYGVLEDSIMIHETDLDIGAFARGFRREACTVDGKNWIDRARTITSTPF